MSSRRNLKKQVNYIAGELFTECMIKESTAYSFLEQLQQKLTN